MSHIKSAISIIQSLSSLKRLNGEMHNIFIGTSGGKDSEVILHLTKQIYPDIPIVHNPKPIDDSLTATHPDTLTHIYTSLAGENIITFVPSHKMIDYINANEKTLQIDGARQVENNRLGKSTDIVKDGKLINRTELDSIMENGLFNLTMCYPIYDWTDDQVFDYIYDNNIILSNEYQTDPDYLAWAKQKQVNK